MSEYRNLLSMKQELDARIAEVRQQEKAYAIAQINSIVQEYQLTRKDILKSIDNIHSDTLEHKKEYRHPITGRTWTGRGRKPRWIQDQDPSQFSVQKDHGGH